MGREKNDSLYQLLAKSKQLESLRQNQKQEEFEKLKHTKPQQTIKIKEMSVKPETKMADTKSVNARTNENQEIISDNVVLKSSPSTNESADGNNKDNKNTALIRKTNNNDQTDKTNAQHAHENPRSSVSNDANKHEDQSGPHNDTKQAVSKDQSSNKESSSKDENILKPDFNDILANIARKARMKSQMNVPKTSAKSQQVQDPNSVQESDSPNI